MKLNMFEDLKEKIKQVPELSGVYLLKDSSNRVIYVGKAISLRQRLRSYLAENGQISPRLRSLQANWADVDFVVTDTEVEALILECNLIKEYKPRYNVNLKDDKDYPYLIITPELYPRLELLRLSQLSSKRARYQPAAGRQEYRFGPFTDVGAVRETMKFLSSIFPLRRCRQPLDGKPAPNRPCLNFQMKRCLAPCRGEEAVSPEEYNRLVKQALLFLKGRYSELQDKLKNQMEETSRNQRFEEAAALRDRLQSLQRVAGQQQKMALNEEDAERDVLALARHGGRSAVHLFQVRGGKLLSQDHYPLAGAEDVEDEEVIASFIKNYYNRVEIVPEEIVVSNCPTDVELLAEWLKFKAEKKVNLRIPKRGSSKKLVELARRNCYLRLQEDEEQKIKRNEQPLEELGNLVGLDKPPQRIEGYDISHLRGCESVGAMVVFVDGNPSKKDYRRFNIKSAPREDDYAALQEVLKRRVAKEDWPRPDLILIDGGRGQLNSAREVLANTSFNNISLVALAKNPDQLLLESAELPLRLSANNPVLQMLQRIRDEVHRFAIGGHRRRKGRKSIHSALEDIPGIGVSRRKILLQHFGSAEKIRKAEVKELAEVPGISSDLAQVIYDHLNKQEEAKEIFEAEKENY
ncbi:MAG: excinuclease ABC subunit UvrC [Bacillota bacterium]